MKKSKSVKLLLITMTVIFALGLGGIYFRHHTVRTTPYAMTQTPKIHGTVLRKPQAMKDFQMTGTDGEPFTHESLKGHWSLLFFGFSNCSYVCPTTLSELQKMYAHLEKSLPKTALPQVVMVTVDPDRDTIKRLRGFLHQFNPHFTGARGTKAELKALTAQMHVAYTKIESKDQSKSHSKHASMHYTMTHSAHITLVDPQGNIRAFFSYPHKGEEMAKDYLKVISSAPHPKAHQDQKGAERAIHDTSGKKYTLQSLRGRWVLINYWASWCPSCRREINALNHFYRAHKNQVTLLSVGYGVSNIESLESDRRALRIHYPVLTSNPARFFSLGEVHLLPVTFVLNPRGQLVRKLIGPQTQDSLEAAITT